MELQKSFPRQETFSYPCAPCRDPESGRTNPSIGARSLAAAELPSLVAPIMAPALVVELADITRCICIILEQRLAACHYPARSHRKRPPHSLRAPKRSGSEPHGCLPLTRSLRPRCVHDALEANSRRPHPHEEDHHLERPGCRFDRKLLVGRQTASALTGSERHSGAWESQPWP